MTDDDRTAIAGLRIEIASLGRDVTYVQKEIAEMRLIFSRLTWLVMAGLVAGILRFALEGGLNA